MSDLEHTDVPSRKSISEPRGSPQPWSQVTLQESLILRLESQSPSSERLPIVIGVALVTNFNMYVTLYRTYGTLEQKVRVRVGYLG